MPTYLDRYHDRTIVHLKDALGALSELARWRCLIAGCGEIIEGTNDREVLVKAKAHFDAEHCEPSPSFGLSMKRRRRTKPNLRKQGARPKGRVRKVTIRLDLEGDLAQKFILLKRKKGLKNNSELVRELISEAYERLQAFF